MGTPLPSATGARAEETSSSIPNANAAPEVTAQDLVDALKNNGGFDAVRSEVLKSFTASRAGEEFAERTQQTISDILYELYEQPQQSTSTSHNRTSSASGGLYTSPTRYGTAKRSKQDATTYIYKSLERQTAYDRAVDAVPDFIREATKSLDGDLDILLKSIASEREAKSAAQKQEQQQRDTQHASTDADMKTD